MTRKPRTWRLRLTLAIALAGACVSCGDDAAPKPPRPRADAGDEDSGVAGDASLVADGAPAADGGELPGSDLWASRDGVDSAPGTREAPTSLRAGLERLEPGHTLYLRGGTYQLAEQITITRENSGAAGAVKTLSQYQHEAPILDFSGQSADASGLVIEASHWHVVGLVVRGAGMAGIQVAGDHNLVERAATFENRGTGLVIAPVAGSADRPSANRIVNCESFENRSPQGDAADGFGARAIGPDNSFRGCVAHHNIDDGWDVEADAADGAVTIDQCVAHTNGVLLDGTHSSEGERDGFVLGSTGAEAAHRVTRSIAYYNDSSGFTSNGNPGALRVSNNLAFDNTQGNFAFGESAAAVFANNVSVWVQAGAAKPDAVPGKNLAGSNRFWVDGGSGAGASDFANVLRLPRLLRNELGDLQFEPFALASTSPLVDAGVVPDMLPFDVTYYQGKPDLGAVELR